MFAPQNRGVVIEKTDEGIDISTNLLKKGYIDEAEIGRFPGVGKSSGIHPVIDETKECIGCGTSSYFE